MADPVPVIPLQYATAETRGRRVSAVFVACVAGGWLACGATWLLIWLWDIKVVLVAGPLIFAAGLAGLAGGLRARAAWLLAAGTAHCSVCALFVALVNLLDWGPHQAREPFLLMGAAYCVLALPLTIMTVRRSGVGRRT